MSIKIGHASQDENKRYSGGQAGDSTQKEVCERSWYSKPWNYYLECIDTTIANIAATYMEQICASNMVGYDQGQRLTLYNQLKNHKDVSKLTPCECDCSSLVTCCYIMAGLNISPSCTTRNLRSALMATGKFRLYTDSSHLTNDKYAKRGGLYLKEGAHVVMALENSSNYTNNSVSSILKGIDLSGYNVVTDYNVVKKDGVQFAILKIIRKDLNVDKLFATHLNGFKKVGINIQGVYNYSYATTVEKAKSDASKVVQYLKQYNMPKSTVVYMDVEDNCQKNLGKLLIDMINAYQSVIEKDGYQFALYTGQSFWNSFIKPYKSALKCKREWIARYYNSYSEMKFSTNPNESYKPNIGAEIEGWQYTSSGIVSGINGRVDLNVLYNTSTLSSTPTIKNVVRVDTSLNVRNKPNGDKVGSLRNGDEIEVLSYKDNFYQIGTNQWVSSDYIQSTRGIVNASTLNLRAGYGTNYADIGDIPRNTTLPILAEKNGWYYTVYNKTAGWVSADYINIL